MDRFYNPRSGIIAFFNLKTHYDVCFLSRIIGKSLAILQTIKANTLYTYGYGTV